MLLGELRSPGADSSANPAHAEAPLAEQPRAVRPDLEDIRGGTRGLPGRPLPASSEGSLPAPVSADPGGSVLGPERSGRAPDVHPVRRIRRYGGNLPARVTGLRGQHLGTVPGSLRAGCPRRVRMPNSLGTVVDDDPVTTKRPSTTTTTRRPRNG
uniref:(northern house mosquito) hypothetical protein n=1 Tax=Culex pipiens TaxID=7175 RepID=A0A8D8IU61_CULPI